MIILFAKAVLGFIFLSKGAGALGLGGVRLEGLGLETSSKLGVGWLGRTLVQKQNYLQEKYSGVSFIRHDWKKTCL
jgi:hypothetical protein